MTTLGEFFQTEAREFLAQLEKALESPTPAADALHSAVRGLRGTAQMAREERVYRAVAAFEAFTRGLARDAAQWSQEMSQQARETVEDLRALVDRAGDDADLDATADAAAARWGGAAERQPAADARAGLAEFRRFAAGEVAGIIEALETGVQQMADAPRDREPLRNVLRRQRALLGSARLDDIPVVAEILRILEDLTRVIAKLDVGVKQEWLDIYRVARDGLRGAIEPLQRNEDPEPTRELSRLRHMREELIERYGSGEAVSAAHDEGLVQAAPLTEQYAQGEPAAEQSEDAVADEDELPELLLTELVDEGSEDDDVDAMDLVAAASNAMQRAGAAAPAQDVLELSIDELVYSPDAALRRAAELRGVIERVAAHDPVAREAVDELFDLIRIAGG